MAVPRLPAPRPHPGFYSEDLVPCGRSQEGWRAGLQEGRCESRGPDLGARSGLRRGHVGSRGQGICPPWGAVPPAPLSGTRTNTWWGAGTQRGESHRHFPWGSSLGALELPGFPGDRPTIFPGSKSSEESREAAQLGASALGSQHISRFLIPSLAQPRELSRWGPPASVAASVLTGRGSGGDLVNRAGKAPVHFWIPQMLI